MEIHLKDKGYKQLEQVHEDLHQYTETLEPDQEIHVVDIQRNFLQSFRFPSNFPLENLLKLDLGVNGLTEFPDLSAARNLKELYLNNNTITRINVESLQNFHQLQVLDLMQNHITELELPSNLAPSLVYLSFSSNLLEKVTSYPVFQKLRHLHMFAAMKLSRSDCELILSNSPTVESLFIGATAVADVPTPSIAQQRHLLEDFGLTKLNRIDGIIVSRSSILKMNK